MALPSLNILRTFEAAARHESFNKAAEELNISPSAVSHQIRQLESTLGVKLFGRTARRVVLTEKGEFYFKHVQEGIHILLQATQSLMDPTREQQIRMSVVPFFATRWLMPRLESFQAQHPGWELAIQTSTQKSDFDREDLDLVIRRGAGNWPGLTQHLLLEEELIAVALPSLAARITSLQDLKKASLLYNSQVPGEWQDWFAQLGEDFSPPTARLEFQNNSQILEACLAGAGIALMDRRLLQQELEDRRVVPAFKASVCGMRNHYLVYPEGHGNHASIKLFRDWLQSILTQNQNSY